MLFFVCFEAENLDFSKNFSLKQQAVDLCIAVDLCRRLICCRLVCVAGQFVAGQLIKTNCRRLICSRSIDVIPTFSSKLKTMAY